MTAPEINEDPLYNLLQRALVDEFNQRRAGGESCDLRHADLEGLDLRTIDARGLDLGEADLQQADIRGVDFSRTNLEGAIIGGAKISGTYFPREILAEEITLSLVHGTRLRYR